MSWVPESRAAALRIPYDFRVVAMGDETLRTVDIERTATGRYVARNTRGVTLEFGTATAKPDGFTPVELLLAAIGGCTAADVDIATSRHVEPDKFEVSVRGNKIRDDTGGNRLTDLTVTLTVRLPGGEASQPARAILPRAVRLSHDRLCTVSRTVELGTPVTTVLSTSDSTAETT
jgi:putative redox protein